MNWNLLTDAISVNQFMNLYDAFQDSCIKEVFYNNNVFVDNNLYMNFTKAKINIIFQRQMKEPAVIEVQFIDVIESKLTINANEFALINIASLILKDNLFYWVEGFYDGKNPLKTESNYIIANSIGWRILEEKYLGNKQIYQLFG